MAVMRAIVGRCAIRAAIAMTSIKHESAWRGTADCRRCGIRDMVLFADLHDEDFNLIHAPIDDLEFQAGRSLVRLGETATSLYSLRSGMVKLVRNTVDGRQRIVRVLHRIAHQLDHAGAQ